MNDRALEVREGGLDDPRVQRLLQAHVARARAETGRGSAHALDLSGLRGAGIEFWTVWEDDEPLGTGAERRRITSHSRSSNCEALPGRAPGPLL